MLILISSAIAQEQDKPDLHIIQLTGIVFASDSSTIIPGVHIYVPKAGRGTTTNPYGFFSMPVVEGDSIIFSAVGFKRQYFKVPAHNEPNSFKLIVNMKEDIAFLKEVEVFPYPSEAMFKEAVLSLELPYQREYDNMNAWIAQNYMRRGYANLPASANSNYRYQTYQQEQAIRNRYQQPANNLLNPFAWARFIRDLKKEKN